MSTEMMPGTDSGMGTGADEGRKISLSRGDVQRSFWLWTFFSHAICRFPVIARSGSSAWSATTTPDTTQAW